MTHHSSIPCPWSPRKSQLPRMGIVKVGGAGRHREMQNEMECSRMGGNVSQAAAWAFWGVRSKECFHFILVGGVLFKFYFNFGGCASLPLMRIPRDWYSLRYVLLCCSAYATLRAPLQEVLSYVSTPAPGIPSCLLVSAGDSCYGPVCVCSPCWRTSWGAASELHCITPGTIDCPPLTFFRKPR